MFNAKFKVDNMRNFSVMYLKWFFNLLKNIEIGFLSL